MQQLFWPVSCTHQSCLNSSEANNIHVQISISSSLHRFSDSATLCCSLSCNPADHHTTDVDQGRSFSGLDRMSTWGLYLSCWSKTSFFSLSFMYLPWSPQLNFDSISSHSTESLPLLGSSMNPLLRYSSLISMLTFRDARKTDSLFAPDALLDQPTSFCI